MNVDSFCRHFFSSLKMRQLRSPGPDRSPGRFFFRNHKRACAKSAGQHGRARARVPGCGSATQCGCEQEDRVRWKAGESSRGKCGKPRVNFRANKTLCRLTIGGVLVASGLTAGETARFCRERRGKQTRSGCRPEYCPDGHLPGNGLHPIGLAGVAPSLPAPIPRATRPAQAVHSRVHREPQSRTSF